MPKPKASVKCSYCNKKGFYIYHRNKKGKVDWAVCFDCFKKFFDKLLGNAEGGGRLNE